MKNVNSILALFLGVSMLMVAACNGSSKQDQKEDEKADETEQQVEILYPEWKEGVAFTHLAKVALEDKGYDVKIRSEVPASIYASLAKGDADLFLDAWLPHTHAEYWEEFGDQLLKIGESFSNGTTGLVVPEYVDIESIEDLNDHVDDFDGEIIGVESEAGIHASTEKAIEAYELEYEQVMPDEETMESFLGNAYDDKEPIVITGWKPHPKWSSYDLKYLEDPKEVYPKDVCAILSRQGFVEDFPVLEKFFENFNLQETELYDLMDAIEKNDDAEMAALEWYKAHEMMVESWWPKEDIAKDTEEE